MPIRLWSTVVSHDITVDIAGDDARAGATVVYALTGPSALT